MAKKVPMRQCIGCGEMKEKRDLIRIVKAADQSVSVDYTGRANGRGAYMCDSLECLKLARKKNALNRAYAAPVPDEIYEQLQQEIEAHHAG